MSVAEQLTQIIARIDLKKRIMKTGNIKSNGQTIYWESHGKGTPLVLVMEIGYDATL